MDCIPTHFANVWISIPPIAIANVFLHVYLQTYYICDSANTFFFLNHVIHLFQYKIDQIDEMMRNKKE